MKSTTILSAYIKATSRDFVMGRRLRQCEKFHAALLRRIEAGDRVIAALKQFADRRSWEYGSDGLVIWDCGIIVDNCWKSTDPAEIAQRALGISNVTE